MASQRPPDQARVIVVMGVSGVGKSSVGSRLAERLAFAFADADGDHPEANRSKMASGTPLDDADRAPWLERLRRRIVGCLTDGSSLVLACSALKAAYRDALAGGDPRVVFLHLDAPRDFLLDRISSRSGHWFPPDLLDSQFAALEPPVEAIRVDATLALDRVVDVAIERLEPHLPA
jgi:gluconokinase